MKNNFNNNRQTSVSTSSGGLSSTAVVYADPPENVNFAKLQENLQTCLSLLDNEVLKNYVPSLQDCEVVEFDNSILKDDTKRIQFFRITELVYQENEFSVHKLATVFNALSNKPCTLVLMIQSDGKTNNFYLGVRPRGNSSAKTMRDLLKRGLYGLFPGSCTKKCLNEELDNLLTDIKNQVGCVAAVTCIADYKQDEESPENKEFIQGLEKFVYSMQGSAFTAVFIANNLEHRDLLETRREFEQIYTLMSPFANMQINYSINQSTAVTESDTDGSSETNSVGSSSGTSLTETDSRALQKGSSRGSSLTETRGRNKSVSTGESHTSGTSDGVSYSESTTHTESKFKSNSVSVGVNSSVNAGLNFNGVGVGKSVGKSIGYSHTSGVSSSVARGSTQGTSHTNSISDSISQNLTAGINSSKSVGNTIGSSESQTDSKAIGVGTQYSENQGYSISSNTAHTKALADTFGNSQAVTLNMQNKSLANMLQRLEKQLERLDECESIGMWDFAAYFLGESAAEAETAAGMYRSLVSGNQSGLEVSAVNSWDEPKQVREISKYVTNFLHPVFRYRSIEGAAERETMVDATALVSTNELAIQLGLPRKSVKGLAVSEHAAFGQEVLSENANDKNSNAVKLGTVNHLGMETGISVNLDLQSLSMHTFVTGSTGAGKSNTVYQILSQLHALTAKKVKFLVIEPAKGEYKNIFGNDRDVKVYGTNPALSELLRINPFSFPKEIHIYEHLDRLVEIFNVCWPMYAAMPAVLKDAIERSYVRAGWDLRSSSNKYSDRLFPCFADVLEEIDAVMEQSQYSGDNKSNYKGALSTRLRSLSNGINGMVFTSNEISAAELFDENVIVDLSRVGSTETKSLIMGLLVMKLQEHRMSACEEMNADLCHVTVLEEAHNLLKRTSTEQSSESSNLLGKSVEMLTNAIAEMRTYGEGFIIADQSPGLLDMAVIRNTNTKIIMRLPEYSDRELVGRAAGLNDEQISELAKLKKGVAAVYQNDWLEAVLCKVGKYKSDAKPYVYRPREAVDNPNLKGKIVEILLNENIDHIADLVDEDILKADIPTSVKCELLDYGKNSRRSKIDYAAKIAYDLFSAKSAFSLIENQKLDPDEQKRILCESLTPSLTPFPKEHAMKLLDYIIYYHAMFTKTPASRLLFNNHLILKERMEYTNV